MARIIITGNKKYVSRLSKHLKKEHPSTRQRMRVCTRKRSRIRRRR